MTALFNYLGLKARRAARMLIEQNYGACMFKHSIAAIFLLIGSSAVAWADCEERIGFTEWTNPEVKSGCGADRTQDPLRHGTPVEQGVDVTTNDRGAVDFSFFDRSRLLVGPQCKKVTLDETYYDPDFPSIKKFSVYDAIRCLMEASAAAAPNKSKIVLEILKTPLGTIQIAIAGADTLVFYAPDQDLQQSWSNFGAAVDRPSLHLASFSVDRRSFSLAPARHIRIAQAVPGGSAVVGDFDQAATALAERYELLVVKLSQAGEVIVEALATRYEILRPEFMVWKARGGGTLEGPDRIDPAVLAMLHSRVEGLKLADDQRRKDDYFVRTPPRTGIEPIFRGPCLDFNACPELPEWQPPPYP